MLFTPLIFTMKTQQEITQRIEQLNVLRRLNGLMPSQEAEFMKLTRLQNEE